MDENAPKKTPYQIALVFFAKVSAWIAIPAVFVLVGHVLSKNSSAHTYVVLAAGILAIAISFYGIYKEAVALIEHHDI